jgi:glc operon protein GlcG
MAEAQVHGLTLAEAQAIAAAVLTTGAARRWSPLAAAVVDPVGEVQALLRADGALPMTSRIAVAKARTVLVSGMPSGASEQLPEAIVGAARLLYGGDYVTRAGGVPIRRNGALHGAVGVSGAASDEDEAAALAALEHVLG